MATYRPAMCPLCGKSASVHSGPSWYGHQAELARIQAEAAAVAIIQKLAADGLLSVVGDAVPASVFAIRESRRLEALALEAAR